MIEPVALFWTGGWDSTFRLCQLVIELGVSVQPIYLKNRRHSRAAELRTMRRLRRDLAELASAELIAPTRFVETSSLTRLHRVRNRRVLRRHRLGLQYDQLARFRATFDRDIEMAIEKPHLPRNRRHVQAGFLLEPLVDPETRRLRDELPAGRRDLHHVFGGLVFPLLDVTKREMLERARARGYDRLLLETWTCLTPAWTRKGNRVACGRCRPCRQRIARCRLVVTRRDVVLGRRWRITPGASAG